MTTTKVPNFMVSPPPPSESETTASLDSLSNRLDTLENLNISSRLNSVENNFSNYLPLAGGVLNGDLYNGKDKDFLRIQGGLSNNNGPRLALSGPNHSSMPGEFWLIANDGNQTMELIGKPNGTLSWSGSIPITSNSTQIATTAFVNRRLPYSTGTWTPTLSGSTTAGEFTYTYTNNDGGCYYVKLGNLVVLRAAFTYSITSSPAGQVRISGAPFVSDSYYKGVGGGNNRYWQLMQIGYGVSYLRPQVYKSDGSGAVIPTWDTNDSATTWKNTVGSNDWIIFSLWYRTSS